MTDDTLREKRLARIRGLMAKTTANGCTEEEAKTAAAAVDRLLAEYELDLDEVAVRAQAIELYEVHAYDHPVRFAAKQIGDFCDCKTWTRSDKRTICFLGLEIDVEVSEYLLLLFMRAMDRESDSFTMLNGEYALADAVRQKEMARSFQVGMATRLGERLTHLKSSRDFTQKTGGFDLVLSKGSMVKEAFATLGIELSPGKAGASIRDRASYERGYAAGGNVSINQGVGRNAATSKGALR